MRSKICRRRRASTCSTDSMRCRSTSARAATCASASARIFRPTIAPTPICASRRRSGASNTSRRPARSGRCGPFSSRRQARETLRNLAAEHRLCWKLLGLDKRVGPCFARQLRRCAGACVGEEPLAAHRLRLQTALAPYAVPRWPYPGLAGIRERAAFSERTDVHVIRDWCWLGTASDEGELGRLLETPPRPVFDADICRLLVRTLARGRHDVRILGSASVR